MREHKLALSMIAAGTLSCFVAQLFIIRQGDIRLQATLENREVGLRIERKLDKILESNLRQEGYLLP